MLGECEISVEGVSDSEDEKELDGPRESEGDTLSDNNGEDDFV